MKPLTAADLRHKVTIQRKVDVDDGRGGSAVVMQPIGTPWAELVGLNGRESVMNKVLQGISVHRIRVWYREDVDPTCQIVAGGQTLNVRSAVDPFGTRRELLIIADTEATLPA